MSARRIISKPLSLASSHKRIVIFLMLLILASALTLPSLHASTPTASSEAESGTLSSCASTLSDTSASGGSAIEFASCSSNPSANAGAHLPISYSLSSLTGQVLYVSTTGSDSNSGTVSSPYATLSAAISAASSGATIVVRGGTYRNQGSLNISKPLTIIAYPGETPIFNGATPVSSGWSTTGNLSYRSYTPIPATDGSGISFTSCANQTSSCMGQYPDQVWVGTQQLQQVASESAVVAGTFYVDETNDFLYMMTSDVSKGSVEISNMRTFASISAANVTLNGFEIIRYSNTASDYGVVNLQGTASNTLMDNMFISDSAFQAVQVGPTGSTLNTGSTIENSTIQYSNWMGVGLNSTTSFTFNQDVIGNMNQFGEFTASPQSGSVKTSRTWYTHVLNSQIKNDNSQGLWFDQSNYMAIVAGNDIENNTGDGLFFEISDFMYAINNYIVSPSGGIALKTAGSSDLYIVNNTIIGGQPFIVATDSRSIPGCSDPTQPLCSGSLSSDRDTNSSHPHPATLTWIPSVNLAINNIIGYPTSAICYSPNTVNFCITTHNSSANVALNTILHPADPSNNVPQTLIDGNIYANGSNPVIEVGNNSGVFTTYANGAAFGSAMAGSPVSISGFEAHGYTGNQYINSDGTQTSTLQALEGNAVAVPTESNINPYLAAGTKHYGVTWH